MPESQHMTALGKANETRLARAQLKRELKAGARKIDALLLDPPDYVRGMKLRDLLGAMCRFGDVRVERLMVAALPFASEDVKVSQLTVRARRALLQTLYENHPWAMRKAA